LGVVIDERKERASTNAAFKCCLGPELMILRHWYAEKMSPTLICEDKQNTRTAPPFRLHLLEIFLMSIFCENTDF